ncbi:MAG: phosphotransferase [Verrucomicrobia bacterium]|jgi:fructosamine-3-kinase|nr:phosphotransferase [Verrucomicrobiota bacterium]
MLLSPKEILSNAISEATGAAFTPTTVQRASGGCINEAYLTSDGTASYFVKFNTAERLPMFEAEAAGLRAIAGTATIRVPEPVGCGLTAGRSYLVLKVLVFGGAKTGSWAQMGRELARLHQNTRAQFGWDRENTIGPTPQANTWTTDWPSYFREQRLRPQFELARKNGMHFHRSDELLDQVDRLLDGHRPEASLLHGDLWSGNADFLEDGIPVLYDPATYYGDRETDLAFSEFFGGFPAEFYRAYAEVWPLTEGYPQRRELYNLYHVLNHANLFGGYAAQAQAIIDGLVKQSAI